MKYAMKLKNLIKELDPGIVFDKLEDNRIIHYIIPPVVIASGIHMFKERVLPYLTNEQYMKDLLSGMRIAECWSKYPNAFDGHELAYSTLFPIAAAIVLGARLYADRMIIKNLAGQFSSKVSSKVINPVRKRFSKTALNHVARNVGYPTRLGYVKI